MKFSIYDIKAGHDYYGRTVRGFAYPDAPDYFSRDYAVATERTRVLYQDGDNNYRTCNAAAFANWVRRPVKNGVRYLNVPDEDWLCPKCGCGVDAGEGLVVDFDDFPGNTQYPENAGIECSHCGYKGTVRDLLVEHE